MKKKLLCCNECGSDDIAWEIEVDEFGEPIYVGSVTEGHAICQNPDCDTKDGDYGFTEVISKSEYKQSRSLD